MALTPSGFVTRSGATFRCGGLPYYFIGINCFGLIVGPAGFDSDGLVDNTFAWCVSRSTPIRVIRTFGFYDGPNGDGGRSFQNPRGTIDTNWWRGMDLVIKKATDYGVRLIIPLSNGTPTTWGGNLQYAQWGVDASLFAGPASSQTHQFYIHATVKGWYKDQVAAVLNRVNSLTGVAYKNDPAIFAWELANEPDNEGRAVSEWRNWVGEMATYIKGIDANHLVGTGETGYNDTGTGAGTPYTAASIAYNNQNWPFDGTKGVSLSQALNNENIDYGTLHCYPNDFNVFSDIPGGVTWIAETAAICASKGKPLIVEEFGATTTPRAVEIYRPWLAKINEVNACACLWDFMADNEIQGASGFTIRETSADQDDTDVKAELIAANAIAMAKNVAPPPPPPQPETPAGTRPTAAFLRRAERIGG